MRIRLLLTALTLTVIGLRISAQQVIATGPGPIHAIIEHDDSLFLGGSFGQFNANSTWYSLTYDGASFDYHEQLLGGSGFRDFIVINDTLWGMGNGLSSVNQGTNDHVNSIAYRDSGIWKGHNKYSVNNTKSVWGMAQYNGELIMGGNFSVTYPYVARHDGNNYMPLGAGFDNAVNALEVYNSELYAAGVMSNSGATSVNNIAKWNGSTWEDVGAGTDFNISCMEVWSGDLYIAGSFTTAGGQQASRLARWDGNSWFPVLGGVSAMNNNPCYVNELRATPSGLMIGGRFEMVDGMPGHNLALWNGTSLSVVGSLDLLDEIQAIGMYQGEVYFSTFRFGQGTIGKLYGPGTLNIQRPTVPTLSMFPTPVADVLQLDLTPLSGSLEIVVLDMHGRRIMHTTSEGGLNFSLDLQEFAQGNYVVTVRSIDQFLRGRFFKN